MKLSNHVFTKAKIAIFLMMLVFTITSLPQAAKAQSEKDLKAMVERVVEMWNNGNLTLVDELFSSEIVSHMNQQDLEGTDAFKEFVTNVRTAYPDATFKIKQLIIKDDRIVWHWTVTATHEATGKEVQNSGIFILTVAKGKIAEQWTTWNHAATLSQLGYTFSPLSAVVENKAIVNRIVEEIWQKKNPALIDEIYAANYTLSLPDGELHGPEGYRELYTTYTTAFPDCYFTLEELVAEGDKVTIPYTFHGTHNGDLKGIAPTGKQVVMKGTAILRFTDGKVVEERTIFDTLSLMQQIGAVPVPETTKK